MKRLIISGGLAGLVAVALTVIAVAQFIDAHVASGDVSTASSTSDLLHICQPSGTTISPQCPVDTAGADETIFVGSEDLLPGVVKWQKIRLTNTSATYPWDVLSMVAGLTEVSDPGGICAVVPEAVGWQGSTYVQGGVLGVTILGTGPTTVYTGYPVGPVDNLYYDSGNDDHGPLAGSQGFTRLDGSSNRSIHVAPNAYEDLVLGIRLPVTTPSSCMNVIWQLNTTWNIQIHSP